MNRKVLEFLNESIDKAHQHTEKANEFIEVVAIMLHNWLDDMHKSINKDEFSEEDVIKSKFKTANKEDIHQFANIIRDNDSFIQKRGDT